MKICVFCSASDKIPFKYIDVGYELGKLIALHNHSLVFGGYGRGIMGAVARGARDNGGKIISVIPKVFDEDVNNFVAGAEVIMTETMSDRKDKMIELSDLFIGLPGGVGTIDEVFKVITRYDVGEERMKPIALLLMGPTQEALSDFLLQAEKEGFVSEKTMSFVKLCHTVDDLEKLLV